MWILIRLAMAAPAIDDSSCATAQITDSLPRNGAVDVDPASPLVLLFDDGGCGVWGEWILESEAGNADGFLEDVDFYGRSIRARITPDLEPLTAYQLTVFTDQEPLTIRFDTSDLVEAPAAPSPPELNWEVLQVTQRQGQLIAFADVHTRAAPEHLVTLDAEGLPLLIDVADGTLRTVSVTFAFEEGEHCLHATTEARDGQRSDPTEACQLLEAPLEEVDEAALEPYEPQGCGCTQGASPWGLFGAIFLGVLIQRRSGTGSPPTD